MQVIFQRFCWNSNWPHGSTWKFFVGAKTLKVKVGNYTNFTIKMCRWLKSKIIHILQSNYPPPGNVQVILLKFKMATDFLNICDRKNFNLIYDVGWYRTSGFLFQFEIIINVLLRALSASLVYGINILFFSVRDLLYRSESYVYIDGPRAQRVKIDLNLTFFHFDYKDLDNGNKRMIDTFRNSHHCLMGVASWPSSR